MRPQLIVNPPKLIDRPGQDPNPFIPFKGKITVQGSHKIKNNVGASFRIEEAFEDGPAQFYLIEFQLESQDKTFRTSFLTQELFRPTQHLLHEICIPSICFESDEPTEQILHRIYSEHLDQIQEQHGIAVTIFTETEKLSVEIQIGKYRGTETLTTEEKITEEALEKLFDLR